MRLPQRPDRPTSAEIPSIEQSVDKFIASLNKQHLSWETLRKYEALLKRRLLLWCAARQYRALSDLDVTRLDDFRETWQDGALYATKNLERLREFFPVRRGTRLDREEPSESVQVIADPFFANIALLYSVEEMERILAACDGYRGDKNRIRAFVVAMRYSGLRISDTIALHPDQLTEHPLRLYTAKTGRPVYVPLPPFVVDPLKKVERPAQRYFSTGKAKPSGRSREPVTIPGVAIRDCQDQERNPIDVPIC